MIGGAVFRVRRALVEGRSILLTSLRGMIANRMRAFLSTLGIAIGVATLIGIFAMVQGLQQSFARQISSLGSSTLYITSRPWMSRGDWWRFRNRPRISDRDVEALRRNATLLVNIAPVGFSMAEVTYLSERMSMVQVRGTTDEYLETSNLKVELGRFLSPLDTELGQHVVVIGSELRRQLFRGANPLGARIRVGSERYVVIGVLKQQGKAFGQSLDNLAIVPLAPFQRAFGARRDLAIAVTAPPEKLNQAEQQVVEVLRRARGLSADKEDNFAVNQQAALVRLFNEETRVIFSVALAIGLITLIVGGIGVMNIMLVAVTERTREIGVRRALGARRRTILLQFLAEASMVTVVGGAVGTALGLGGTQILARITPVSAALTPQAAVLGIVFSALVGLLFGTWPAYRAARLDPIESLRYE